MLENLPDKPIQMTFDMMNMCSEYMFLLEREEIYVSTRTIAEKFGKTHKDVLEAFDEGMAENSANPFWEQNFIQTTYIHEQNKREFREILCNQKGFMFLVLGFTGKKAQAMKIEYIQAFDTMKDYILDSQQTEQLKIYRETGKIVRKTLVDQVKDVYGADASPQVYGGLTNIAYRLALGITGTELKKKLGIKNGKLRESLDPDQLQKLEKAETRVTAYLIQGADSGVKASEIVVWVRKKLLGF